MSSHLQVMFTAMKHVKEYAIHEFDLNNYPNCQLTFEVEKQTTNSHYLIR
jgi:hypothetical protein